MSQQVTLEAVFEALHTVNRKLDLLLNPNPFISRQEIVAEIGRKAYDNGVATGQLTPVKSRGRNGKIRVERAEYQEYITSLKS